MYQFLLNSSAPAGTYTLTVTGYPGGYLPMPSILIPGCGTTVAVTATPNPAVVQSSSSAPSASVPNLVSASCPTTSSGLAAGAGTTQYFYKFDLTPGTSSNVVNNHIALDPILGGAIVVSKKTPLVNVSRGDLVPYTVTATNTLSATLGNIDLRDQLPPGFKFKVGTASVDGVPVAPTVSGRMLTWPNLTFTAHQSRVIKLMTVVGSGVSEGNYVNQAYALNNIVNAAVSNTASATVRVVPDPTFDCSDLIGKVFDDKNANGYQDAGEPGIPNVRLATVNGLLVTTDAQGRYHVTCAMVPNEWRGSNFLMKLDERTLPTGFRVTTENPRDVRLTSGKMSKLNFGATIHRVVRLDVNDAAYSADALKTEWQAKLDKLPELLKQRPSILRLAYKIGADGEVLCTVTGAQDALVVNNNAAAVLLALCATARGGEVLVSRGQLVEIGDGFRIPDILRASGAELVEVGTTNRTYLRDFEAAWTERTRAVLRVHTSNYRIVGFTSEPRRRSWRPWRTSTTPCSSMTWAAAPWRRCRCSRRSRRWRTASPPAPTS